MKQPEWVDRYVREVLKIEGKTKYPKIVFRKGRGGGCTHYKWKYIHGKRKIVFAYISINSAGNEKIDKMVLFHELAHAMGKVKAGHNLKFWERAWNYYEVFRSELDWEAVKKSEFWYMKKAKTVYEKIYPEQPQVFGQLALDI